MTVRAVMAARLGARLLDLPVGMCPEAAARPIGPTTVRRTFAGARLARRMSGRAVAGPPQPWKPIMNRDTAIDEDEGLVDAPGAADAIEMLSSDHEDVRLLFADFEEQLGDNALVAERALLVKQICSALIAHTIVEEEIFYPAAREAIDQPGLLDQAEAEHASAKALIAQIQHMDPEDAQLEATVMQLQEAIDQHVREEEEELFPLVQESSLDLQQLSEQLAQRKDEVLAELEEAD
jgi:hemerythrin superfamily protein